MGNKEGSGKVSRPPMKRKKEQEEEKKKENSERRKGRKKEQKEKKTTKRTRFGCGFLGLEKEKEGRRKSAQRPEGGNRQKHRSGRKSRTLRSSKERRMGSRKYKLSGHVCGIVSMLETHGACEKKERGRKQFRGKEGGEKKKGKRRRKNKH